MNNSKQFIYCFITLVFTSYARCITRSKYGFIHKDTEIFCERLLSRDYVTHSFIFVFVLLKQKIALNTKKEWIRKSTVSWPVWYHLAKCKIYTHGIDIKKCKARRHFSLRSLQSKSHPMVLWFRITFWLWLIYLRTL